jgi:hypothetical protein
MLISMGDEDMIIFEDPFADISHHIIPRLPPPPLRSLEDKSTSDSAQIENQPPVNSSTEEHVAVGDKDDFPVWKSDSDSWESGSDSDYDDDDT